MDSSGLIINQTFTLTEGYFPRISKESHSHPYLNLKQIFNKDDAAAEKIMLEVHEQGKGVVGSYPFEIAEQKGIEATMLARNEGYPLQIKVQKSKK